MHLLRRIASSVGAALALSCIVSACGSGSVNNALTSTSASTSLSALRSPVNGLYFSPRLLDTSATPEALSYALLSAAEVGVPAHVVLNSQQLHSLREDALAVSPIWGRAILVPIRTAGARSILTSADVVALRRLRTGSGWYAEPGSARTTDGRLLASAQAVQTLAALGGLTTFDRQQTSAWLRSTSADTKSWAVAGAVAQALTVLGAPPLTTSSSLRPPVLHGTDAQSRQRWLDQAYGYLQVSQAAGKPLNLDRTVVTSLLQYNAATSTYTELFKMISLALAVSKPDLGSTKARLFAARQGDGTFADVSGLIGSDIASVYVLRLIALSGRTTHDASLERSLIASEHQSEVSDNPAELLITEAARFMAAGGEPTATLRQLCASVPPHNVSFDNVTGWHETSMMCHDVGINVLAPAVTPWSLNRNGGILQAAEYVVSLRDAGLHAIPPRWIRPERFAAYLQASMRGAIGKPLAALATVARAYRYMHGDPDIVSKVLGLANHLRGCPGMPSLYRLDAGDTSCDLRTTWTVRRLQ